MRKPFIIIVTLVVAILLLAVIQVVVSNRLSTSGVELSKAQAQISEYKKENSELLEKLLVSSSFTQIASASATVGFVESSSHLYLDNKLPIAIQR